MRHLENAYEVEAGTV